MSLPSFCFLCDAEFVGDNFEHDDHEFCSERCLTLFTRLICRECECWVCSCEDIVPSCCSVPCICENDNNCDNDDDDESVSSDDGECYDSSNTVIVVRFNPLLGEDEVIVTHY